MGWCAGQGFGVEVGELVQSSSGGLLPKARREHLVDGMAAFYLFLIFAQITYIQNMRRTLILIVRHSRGPVQGEGTGLARPDSAYVCTTLLSMFMYLYMYSGIKNT